MDRKDLELLRCLFEQGCVDPVSLASSLSLTEENTNRRIRLMLHEGTIRFFSAFFDRRCMGYDTTYLRVHYPNRKRGLVMESIGSLPDVASVYPNMDDFCFVEAVHKGRSSLQKVIDGIEGIIHTCTVSAAYVPRLPDEVPDLKNGIHLSILKELVEDGLIPVKTLANRLGSKEEDIRSLIENMLQRSRVRILPVLNEEDMSPYPCFSFIATLDSPGSLPEALTAMNRIAPMIYERSPLLKPPGIWMRSFGVDLHSMDHMLERIRRMPWVDDLTIILPEGVRMDRSMDISILEEALKRHG
ncbi:MAG: Lrp/AsnC family transcriptional regulator [Candidatus Thermoplasmatota archaeon]|nr:Lrp/AsnC family transcriptional regulator [Candidatus Thermoplasmatota archaeon]